MGLKDAAAFTRLCVDCPFHSNLWPGLLRFSTSLWKMLPMSEGRMSGEKKSTRLRRDIFNRHRVEAITIC